jgi:uncharacterized tellurite resistance protein B-like protein
MFGKWLRVDNTSGPPSGGDALRESVRRELPGADPETISVVTSMVGLLGAVAYADRHYSAAEEEHVRRELARVHGMTTSGIDAICTVLRKHVVELSTLEIPRFARALIELADEELRREILGTLVALAAADEAITLAETNLLRQITKSLGLSQRDYLVAQDLHRQHLASIKT